MNQQTAYALVQRIQNYWGHAINPAAQTDWLDVLDRLHEGTAGTALQRLIATQPDRAPSIAQFLAAYRAEAGTVQGHLDIARYITTPKGEIAGKVLLVDDLADTGHTLRAVVDQLKNNYKPVTELRTAVIWTKGVSTFKPDYSIEDLPTNPWIHQPFEPYDNMRPEKLMEKWRV